MLNIDWFQPFKHRNDYSVGVMYMVLMNLPRNIRLKKENVILVGIIPALVHEPKSLNHFLEPAIDELKALWKGVKVNTFNNPSTSVEVRAALLCCAADIPAARKLCDFLAILLTEDVPTATNYFLVALESAKTTVALTETSGQGGPHTNIVRMLTESKTANLKPKLKS